MKLRGSEEDGGHGAERSRDTQSLSGWPRGAGRCGCTPRPLCCTPLPPTPSSALSAQEASVVFQVRAQKAEKPEEAKPWLHGDQIH